LQGSHDGDLRSFTGARCYHRVAFADDHYWMKAALYIYRADHGQFNTVWGSCDLRPPLGYLLNRRPLLRGAEQRAITQVYVAAFLEATLHGKDEYVPLFHDHHCAAPWLPDTVYFSQFADSGFRMIADFEEATDPTQTSIPGGSQQGEYLRVWQRRPMVGRDGEPLGNHVVALGWERSQETEIPSYTITLPEIPPVMTYLDERMCLSFCLADTGEPNEDTQPIDLTIELAASDGNTARLPLSHVTLLQPALKVTFTKWPYWEHCRYRSPMEPVLQTFEIPLVDFLKANPRFDLGFLRQIRFRFDRTRAATILLDDVGVVARPDHARG
jgi:hypothetical protein